MIKALETALGGNLKDLVPENEVFVGENSVSIVEIEVADMLKLIFGKVGGGRGCRRGLKAVYVKPPGATETPADGVIIRSPVAVFVASVGADLVVNGLLGGWDECNAERQV